MRLCYSHSPIPSPGTCLRNIRHVAQIMMMYSLFTGCQIPVPDEGVAPVRPEQARERDQAIPPSIIPLPLELEMREGEFILSQSTRIELQGLDQDHALVAYLTDEIQKLTGLTLGTTEANRHAGRIVLKQDPSLESVGSEGYTLSVTPKTTWIRAKEPAGLFYGIQTFRQLLPLKDSGGGISCLEIFDQPQFSWRSSMLDVSRHFFSIDYLKRYIDLLAHEKINTLHLHLTDDQGWRFESKNFPKLTSVGAWRNEEGKRYGGFYTQSKLKELVAYADERFITIVPEIDMPGHSQAALAAYPEYACSGMAPTEVRISHKNISDAVFCAGNTNTYAFLFSLLDEVMKVFPSEYIHIGADEVSTRHWASCDHCQAVMQAEGLKREAQLQGVFADKISEHLHARGRRMICWDDLLEDRVPDGATIMFWRTWTGTERIRNAAAMGHDLILAPISHFYLSGEPLTEYVYAYSPETSEITGDLRPRVLGGTAALWTEAIDSTNALEQTTFPQLCAFAEAVWTPATKREWSSFCERMWRHYSLLEIDGVRVDIPSPGGFTDRTMFSDYQDIHITAPEVATIRYTLDGSQPTPTSAHYHQPIRIQDSHLLQAQIEYPGGATGPVRTGRFVRKPRIQPIKTERLIPGLRYRYYEGNISDSPSTKGMSLKREGAIDTFRIPEGTRTDEFMLKFDGLLQIKKSGEYRFYTRSDDGSRLWIGDTMVVDNWGLRPLQTRSGQLFLEEGFYPIRAEFVEASGDELLSVFYEGPESSRQEIPSAALSSPVDSTQPVNTSLPTHQDHAPARALDGDLTTGFWSARSPHAGDHFTLFFDPSRELDSIRVLTGKENSSGDRLIKGQLQVSTNGSDFYPVGDFANGIAEAHFTPRPVQAIHIHITEDQADWLFIREIQIEPFHHSSTD